MNSVNWLEVLCGFGVFLFSLHLLNSVIERSIVKRLRPWIDRFLATHWQCLGVGFVSTILVQASSITIITAMGLVNASLISLEQGFFLMLGATLGTTVKIWIFAENIRNYALILISFSSIALLTSKKPLIRDFLEVLLAIGMAFFGFNMMVFELLPLSQNPNFVEILQFYDGSNIKSQLLGIITGAVLAFAVQSSSTFILLTVGLASQGIISFNAGAAFILGANIGTTSTALFVSLEHGPAARKLAVAYFLVKIIGVGIVCLFFPYFLGLVDILVPGTPKLSVDYHLAGVHSLFNLCNIFLWMPLSMIMLRCASWLVKSENGKHQALPSVVRRIIVSNPNLTLQEIENQIIKAENLAKKLTDHCFEILLHGMPTEPKKQRFSAIMAKDFDNIKDCILELLIKVTTRHTLPPEQMAYVQRQLKFINEYSNFYDHALSLSAHLERGLIVDCYGFPMEILPQFDELQRLLNELWFSVFQKQNAPGKFEKIVEILHTLENAYFTSLIGNTQRKYEQLAWAYEVLNYLYEISIHLHQLCTTIANIPVSVRASD